MIGWSDVSYNAIDTKIYLHGIAFGLAAAAAGVLLILPVYVGFSGERPSRATLVEINGPWVISLLFFPVVLTLLPLIFRKRAVQIAATCLIAGFTIISSFSIGLFFLPATIVSLIATFAERRSDGKTLATDINP